MTKVWLICGGGGFSWESRELASKLEKHFDVHYIFPNESQEARAQFPIERTIFVPTLTARYQLSFVKKITALITLIYIGINNFKFFNDSLVICLGTSLGIPLLTTAKLLGHKTIFVESITRISDLSKTGLFLNKYKIPNKTLVQWKEQENISKEIYFWGNIL